MTSRSRFIALILLAFAAGAAAVTPAQAASGKGNLIQVFMVNAGVDLDARGRVMFVENKAQSFFEIKVSKAAPNATLEVAVDDVPVDSIVTNSGGEGKVRYRVRLKGHNAGGSMPYDPRGKTLTIAAGGLVILTSNVPATPGDSQQPVEIHLDLTNSGVQPLGDAKAEFRSRFGRMKFEVEVEGMLPGTYDLFVGGVDVGDIVVGLSGEEEIEFDTRPCCDDGDGDMELLLTFDPRGQVIEIKEQITTVVLFSGTL